jgi:zinc transporter ZupT
MKAFAAATHGADAAGMSGRSLQGGPMKESTRTWLTVAGAAALLAFAALAYTMFPGIVAETGLDHNDLGGGAAAALVLWLVLRRQQPMARRTRLALGASVAVGLLLGLAVFFIS